MVPAAEKDKGTSEESGKLLNERNVFTLKKQTFSVARQEKCIIT